MRLPVTCLVLTCALFASTATFADADEGPAPRLSVAWISDASGFWDDGANWSTGIAPETGDDVTIDRPGFVTVTIRQPTAAINSLNAAEFVQVNSTLTVTDTAFFDGGMGLTGALTGAGTYTLLSAGTWSGGTISSAMVVGAGDSLTIATTGSHLLSSASLLNQGTVKWSGTGGIDLSGDASITNAVGALWDVQVASTAVTTSTPGPQTFTNLGTLRKSGPTGTFTIGGSVQFVNTGTIRLQVGGTAGGQFDVLALSQPFAFAGTLDVVPIGGFDPRFFHSFNVVTYPSRTGSFAAVQGNGETYIDQYRASALRLRPLAAPLENLIRNGTLNTDLTNWLTYATPNQSYISAVVTGGVLDFARVPPPSGLNQATVYQETQAYLPDATTLAASFDVANVSSVRKRVSVLILDSDFSDLAVCTFFLEPNTPMRTYGMRTQSGRIWDNAALYFYAASAGDVGNAYQLDNVSLHYDLSLPGDRTTCPDPTVPSPPGGAAGTNLLVNGDFGTGSLAPWGLFGQIQAQIAGGVFEFIKLPTTPGTSPGVVLQPTDLTMTAGEILTATFQLGNSSSVRKRVTAVLHDNDFSDLTACTFWLDPGQPLSNYTYRTFTTKAWTNATVSVYPATVGADQWIRLDNVTFQRTPGSAIVGTECLEPGSGADQRVASDGAPAPQGDVTMNGLMMASEDVTIASADDSAVPPAIAQWLSQWVADGFLPVGDWLTGPSWAASASDTRLRTVRPLERLDLTQAVSASVRFASTLRTVSGSQALVQVSYDGATWETVQVIEATSEATAMEIDLAAHLGHTVFVRFAFDGVAPDDGASPDAWRIGDVGLDVVVDVQARRR